MVEDVARDAPRQGVEEAKRDQRDPKRHDDRLTKAADDESGHAGFTILLHLASQDAYLTKYQSSGVRKPKALAA